jgi:hypothetical protein
VKAAFNVVEKGITDPTATEALAVTTLFFFFFFFFIQNVKRVIAVAQLRVAQPTYGTCPITCT